MWVGCRECRAPEIRAKAMEGVGDLDVQTPKDSPAYGARNVRIAAAGTTASRNLSQSLRKSPVVAN